MSCEGGVVRRFIINSICRKRRELYVPDDLITEILSWLPVKSVHRFKCVCRLWCSIAQDIQFVHKHMMRATERTWAVENVCLLKHICQGLVFEPTGGSKSNYRIRNPSTNRVLDLPDINEKVAYAMRLCYISSTRTFKVICPYHNNNDGESALSFKILAVDVDHEWRRFDLPFTSNVAAKSPSYYWSVGSFKGVYVLVLLHKTELEREIVILEVENERVWTVSIRRGGLSSSLSQRISFKHLDTVKRPKDRAVLHHWVVGDYKKQKWAKEEIVLDLARMKNCLCRDCEQPYWFKDKKLIDMSCNDDKLLKVRCGIKSGYLHIQIRKTAPGKKNK